MKTKVCLDHRGYNHWIYMVYVYDEDKKVWNCVQAFGVKERLKAINYAKDIASIPEHNVDADIWESE